MKKKLLIDGMHCQNCVKGLEAVLTEDIDGIKVEEISLDGNYAIIDADDSVSDDAIREGVEELGFTLKEIQV